LQMLHGLMCLSCQVLTCRADEASVDEFASADMDLSAAMASSVSGRGPFRRYCCSACTRAAGAPCSICDHQTRWTVRTAVGQDPVQQVLQCAGRLRSTALTSGRCYRAAVPAEHRVGWQQEAPVQPACRGRNVRPHTSPAGMRRRPGWRGAAGQRSPAEQQTALGKHE
jgi:hypothetical protein